MNYYKDPWWQRHPVWTTVLALMLLAALAFGVWLFSVGTSDFFGRGNVVRQVNSAQNRLGQYDRFVQLDKDIRSQAEQAQLAQKQLDDFTKQYPSTAGESYQVTEQRASLMSNVTGARQVCVSNVNDYNNQAKAYTAQRFRDSNLPDSFDPAACTDPTKLPPLLTNEGTLP